MSLEINEDIQELGKKYWQLEEYVMEKKLKFGSLMNYTSNTLTKSELKNSQMEETKENTKSTKHGFIIKLIKPDKAHAKMFKNFLEAFKNFQSYAKKNCKFLKIVEIFKEKENDSYYIIQKEYNSCLTKEFEKQEGLREIEVFMVLREICRFYYFLLKENEDFANYFLNANLCIRPIAIENITYYRKKKKGKFNPMKLKIDIFEFLEKNEDFGKQTLEELHMANFKQLVIKLFFEHKMEKPHNEEDYFGTLKSVIINSQNSKNIGLITRNFINCLFNPQYQLTWDDIFQHPILKIDIFMKANQYSEQIWRIMRERDYEIQVHFLDPKYVFEVHSEYSDSDEATQKRKYAPKKKEEEEKEEEIREQVRNVEIHNLESSGSGIKQNNLGESGEIEEKINENDMETEEQKGSHKKGEFGSEFCEENEDLRKTQMRSITKNLKKENADNNTPYNDDDDAAAKFLVLKENKESFFKSIDPDENLLIQCKSESEIKEEMSNKDDENSKKKQRKTKKCSSNFCENNDEGFMEDPEADHDYGGMEL